MPVVLSYRNSGAYGCDALDRLTPTPLVYGPFFVESYNHACTNHKRGHPPWLFALQPKEANYPRKVLSPENSRFPHFAQIAENCRFSWRVSKITRGRVCENGEWRMRKEERGKLVKHSETF